LGTTGVETEEKYVFSDGELWVRMGHRSESVCLGPCVDSVCRAKLDHNGEGLIDYVNNLISLDKLRTVNVQRDSEFFNEESKRYSLGFDHGPHFIDLEIAIDKRLFLKHVNFKPISFQICDNEVVLQFGFSFVDKWRCLIWTNHLDLPFGLEVLKARGLA
jgi:hypothetical protein